MPSDIAAAPASAPKKQPSRLKRLLIPALVVLIGLAAFLVRQYLSTSVTFAPYGPGFSEKPDFSQVEHQYPLTRQQLMTITPERLKTLDQEKVDQIYARLTAGPIPDGAYDGALFFPKGICAQNHLGQVLGGLQGAAATLEMAKLTVVGEGLLKGHVLHY